MTKNTVVKYTENEIYVNNVHKVLCVCVEGGVGYIHTDLMLYTSENYSNNWNSQQHLNTTII